MTNDVKPAALLVLCLVLVGCSVVVTGREPAAESDGDEDTPIPTTIPELPRIELPDLGPAPEITNELWINADQPVTLASSRGKVVLLEFWTFG